METKMRKLAFMGASALVLALGVGQAFAMPTTEQIMKVGNGATFPSSTAAATNPAIREGRAAAVEAPAADAFIYQPRFGR
jgi:hypothetical protein